MPLEFICWSIFHFHIQFRPWLQLRCYVTWDGMNPVGIWGPAPIWETTQSLLIRTKDAPHVLITYEIAGVLGALCRSRRQRPMYLFLIISHNFIGFSVNN